MHAAGSEESGHDSRAFFRRAERARPKPAPGLAPGKVVGDFRLVALIGQGGMGQVWEAEQVSLARTVAVKFVRPERVTEKQLELFAREARAGGRLHHPGIVTVHGYGQTEGLAWIAMELVEGAWTLKDFLDEAARESEVPDGYDRHVARFVVEIADALQAAHEAGVIHRDMKPQNVLITSDDHPKVSDFGLARITDETALSQTGDFAGTYYYMSPEQVAARRMGIDHRTDVFSLGVVLYELLALRRPFEGDTSHQVAAQIVSKDPPDIRTIRSRVPRDLAVIAGKALEKDRDKRFQAMAELAGDLRRHLANEPIHARPPTRLDRAVKWTQRNPGKSSAAAIAAVTFTVIALLLAANVRTNRALGRERTSLATANTALKDKTAEAEANEQRAEREAETANERTEEVLRLSALQRLDDLIAEADQLWPAFPENIPRYEDWLRRAESLVAELPAHEAKLTELRAKARPWTAEEQAAFRAGRPRAPEHERVRREIDSVKARSAALEAGERRGDPTPAEVGVDFTFDDAEDRWWHNQLEKLASGIRSFSDETTGLRTSGTSEEHGWGVKKRLASALELRDGFGADGAYARAWSAALPEIRAVYPGLELAPQLGLLPLGPDPESGLWEFAELQTGEPAVRGADGKLVLEEETGLVCVLLPGGTLQMGAQKSDPNGPNYDPEAQSDEGPVHAVTLSTFFLSKYEMTQGQWQRFAGGNPSYYKPPAGLASSLLHPAEQVTWTACAELCARLGLSLPSEAQWEYAARGGTESVWWRGDERESLRGAANMADQAAARAGAEWPEIKDWPELDDGFVVHAPVDRFVPNPFGLHNVHGNIWEWCLDGYQSDFYGHTATQDPVFAPEGSSNRVNRGGSFGDAAVIARSANRLSRPPGSAVNNLGLRPARTIAP